MVFIRVFSFRSLSSGAFFLQCPLITCHNGSIPMPSNIRFCYTVPHHKHHINRSYFPSHQMCITLSIAERFGYRLCFRGLVTQVVWRFIYVFCPLYHWICNLCSLILICHLIDSACSAVVPWNTPPVVVIPGSQFVLLLLLQNWDCTGYAFLI